MCRIATDRVAEAGLADRVELRVGAVPPISREDDSFDTAFMSFTLELFPPAAIPGVLAEARRVLAPGGRLAVVSMATVPEGGRESAMEHLYRWMHQHFPHIVDCQPIDAGRLLQEAGFTISQRVEMEIWAMPVVALVGVLPHVGKQGDESIIGQVPCR